MEGLIEEGKELLEEDAEEEVLDAGLISKAQHVEHYEMAGYGTVRTYALLLGENSHAELLQQTLDEEGAADKLLTQLAQSINVDAIVGDDASDEETETRGEREVQRVVAKDQSSSRTAGKSGTKGKSSTRSRDART